MFCRAFRMSFLTFKKLFKILQADLRKVAGRDNSNSKKVHPVNGLIPLSVRLGISIRMFAGGEAYDISPLFSVSYTEVFSSISMVLDAINMNEDLKIEFPESHDEQNQIAADFTAKSKANFDCCVGCIDRMLVWIHKPSKKECKKIKVSQGKFLCGRKKIRIELTGRLRCQTTIS